MRHNWVRFRFISLDVVIDNTEVYIRKFRSKFSLDIFSDNPKSTYATITQFIGRWACLNAMFFVTYLFTARHKFPYYSDIV